MWSVSHRISRPTWGSGMCILDASDPRRISVVNEVTMYLAKESTWANAQSPWIAGLESIVTILDSLGAMQELVLGIEHSRCPTHISVFVDGTHSHDFHKVPDCADGKRPKASLCLHSSRVNPKS